METQKDKDALVEVYRIAKQSKSRVKGNDLRPIINDWKVYTGVTSIFPSTMVPLFTRQSEDQPVKLHSISSGSGQSIS